MLVMPFSLAQRGVRSWRESAVKFWDRLSRTGSPVLGDLPYT
ncbi:hypothetical protein [Streptomyces sp. SID1121]